MAKPDKKALVIARRIRKWGEKVARQLKDAGFYFYNPDNLSMMCTVCSCKLFLELEKEGYYPLFVSCVGHVYVQLDDYVIDVTATQFSPAYPKVLVREYSKMSDKKYWKPFEKISCSKKMLRLVGKWDEDQSYPHMTKFCKSLGIEF